MKDPNIPAYGSLTLISGPCSAESESQLRAAAEFFCRFNRENPRFRVDSLRAGVWKPRSRPGTFEGQGEKALVWMQNIRRDFGLPTITEIASAQHAELCMKYGMDRFWIGARTSANPFLMQEIAESLRGCRFPVYVKNPISPDLSLWTGGMERIEALSGGPVHAIHRGFSLYNSEPFRNAPLWELPVELKRSRPERKIICDPSHIAGKRSLVAGIAQTALDLEMDGLMIEVHPCPENALSDASQQLDFSQFENLMASLVVRRQQGASARIEQIRCMLDEVDDELLQLLAKRMEMVKDLGRLKKQENLSVLQMERWKNVVRRGLDAAARRGLDPGFVQNLLNCIHTEALRLQHDIIDEPEK